MDASQAHVLSCTGDLAAASALFDSSCAQMRALTQALEARAAAAAEKAAAEKAAAETEEEEQQEQVAVEGRSNLLTAHAMHAQALRRWSAHEGRLGRHAEGAEALRRAEELEERYGFSAG